MIKFLPLIVITLFIYNIALSQKENNKQSWSISVLPSSLRLDPTTNKIIEERFAAVKNGLAEKGNLLEKNWIYDGKNVSLKSARGEYISFQIIITNNNPDSTLKGIKIEIPSFKNATNEFKIKPELFLEWSVNVKTPSTGYPKASLGKGWYPDALIPFKYIQDDTLKAKGRLVYPLWLPDFNNRIDNQRSLLIWVDQYIPFAYEDAKPGTYSTNVSVIIGKQTQKIPVDLTVWNFAIPNENRLKASLQHEGFLSSMNKDRELEIYQLFKRNRISLMDPTYKPQMKKSSGSQQKIDWTSFDNRLKKYITGEAFSSKFGYDYGPGYGEPIETFMLPFDVYGKHGTAGWPDVGKPDVERNTSNQLLYFNTIKEVRNHLLSFINSKKTDITVYLNGLDESYFPEAWSRMVYYGNLFHKAYPEAQFRVDGGYNEEAMNIIGKSINAWATHTINYNIDEIRKYQKMGIKDWLYGPMLYESKVNSWVGSSTFIDLPLVNDRAISWSCRKYNAYSWLSWGIGGGWERGWYDPESWKDAFKGEAEADAVFSYKKLNGNALLIYSPGIVPNVDGPCPSIRLKTMRNGVQEYEYMRLLSDIDKNNDRVNNIVNRIIKQPFGDKSIGNLDVWSYDPEEWDKGRNEMGESINQPQSVSKNFNHEKFPNELVAFIPYKLNPIFKGTGTNTWDNQIRERGYILFENGIYKMWYTGYNGDDTVTKYLGYATSADGINWKRYPKNPIFKEKWTEDMCVIKNESKYYMFAEGRNDVAHSLVSDDGISWKEEGDLNIKTIDGKLISGPYGTPTVWTENGKWYLFYERNDEAIWLAQSNDHKNWVNVQEEPVIKTGPAKYDSGAVAANQIIKYKGKYYLYYHASSNPMVSSTEWTSNVAMSTDLIHWIKYPENPIVEGDHSSPITVFDGKRFRLYTVHDKVFLYFSKQ